MSTVETRNQLRAPLGQEDERSAEIIGGGSFGESLAAIGVVVLAIVGLAGVYPNYLTPIACLVLAGALVLEGVAIVVRYSRLINEISPTMHSAGELGEGMTAEVAGGAAGIVLGILALIGIYPTVLLPITAIIFGAVLVLGSASNWSLNHMLVEHRFEGITHIRTLAASMVTAATGAQVLVGLGGIVLGIIALTGLIPWTLTLVAFLAVGASLALSGAAVGARMMGMLRR